MHVTRGRKQRHQRTAASNLRVQPAASVHSRLNSVSASVTTKTGAHADISGEEQQTLHKLLHVEGTPRRSVVQSLSNSDNSSFFDAHVHSRSRSHSRSPRSSSANSVEIVCAYSPPFNSPPTSQISNASNTSYTSNTSATHSGPIQMPSRPKSRSHSNSASISVTFESSHIASIVDPSRPPNSSHTISTVSNRSHASVSASRGSLSSQRLRHAQLTQQLHKSRQSLLSPRDLPRVSHATRRHSASRTLGSSHTPSRRSKSAVATVVRRDSEHIRNDGKIGSNASNPSNANIANNGSKNGGNSRGRRRSRRTPTIGSAATLSTVSDVEEAVDSPAGRVGIDSAVKMHSFRPDLLHSKSANIVVCKPFSFPLTAVMDASEDNALQNDAQTGGKVNGLQNGSNAANENKSDEFEWGANVIDVSDHSEDFEAYDQLWNVPQQMDVTRIPQHNSCDRTTHEVDTKLLRRSRSTPTQSTPIHRGDSRHARKPGNFANVVNVMNVGSVGKDEKMNEIVAKNGNDAKIDANRKNDGMESKASQLPKNHKIGTDRADGVISANDANDANDAIRREKRKVSRRRSRRSASIESEFAAFTGPSLIDVYSNDSINVLSPDAADAPNSAGASDVVDANDGLVVLSSLRSVSALSSPSSLPTISENNSKKDDKDAKGAKCPNKCLDGKSAGNAQDIELDAELRRKLTNPLQYNQIVNKVQTRWSESNSAHIVVDNIIVSKHQTRAPRPRAETTQNETKTNKEHEHEEMKLIKQSCDSSYFTQGSARMRALKQLKQGKDEMKKDVDENSICVAVYVAHERAYQVESILAQLYDNYASLTQKLPHWDENTFPTVPKLNICLILDGWAQNTSKSMKNYIKKMFPKKYPIFPKPKHSKRSKSRLRASPKATISQKKTAPTISNNVNVSKNPNKLPVRRPRTRSARSRSFSRGDPLSIPTGRTNHLDVGQMQPRGYQGMRTKPLRERRKRSNSMAPEFEWKRNHIFNPAVSKGAYNYKSRASLASPASFASQTPKTCKTFRTSHRSQSARITAEFARETNELEGEGELEVTGVSANFGHKRMRAGANARLTKTAGIMRGRYGSSIGLKQKQKRDAAARAMQDLMDFRLEWQRMSGIAVGSEISAPVPQIGTKRESEVGESNRRKEASNALGDDVTLSEPDSKSLKASPRDSLVSVQIDVAASENDAEDAGIMPLSAESLIASNSSNTSNSGASDFVVNIDALEAEREDISPAGRENELLSPKSTLHSISSQESGSSRMSAVSGKSSSYSSQSSAGSASRSGSSAKVKRSSASIGSIGSIGSNGSNGSNASDGLSQNKLSVGYATGRRMRVASIDSDASVGSTGSAGSCDSGASGLDVHASGNQSGVMFGTGVRRVKNVSKKDFEASVVTEVPDDVEYLWECQKEFETFDKMKHGPVTYIFEKTVDNPTYFCSRFDRIESSTGRRAYERRIQHQRRLHLTLVLKMDRRGTSNSKEWFLSQHGGFCTALRPKYVMQIDCKHCVQFGDDSVLCRLVRHLEGDPRAGMVSPRLRIVDIAAGPNAKERDRARGGRRDLKVIGQDASCTGWGAKVLGKACELEAEIRGCVVNACYGRLGYMPAVESCGLYRWRGVLDAKHATTGGTRAVADEWIGKVQAQSAQIGLKEANMLRQGELRLGQLAMQSGYACYMGYEPDACVLRQTGSACEDIMHRKENQFDSLFATLWEVLNGNIGCESFRESCLHNVVVRGLYLIHLMLMCVIALMPAFSFSMLHFSIEYLSVLISYGSTEGTESHSVISVFSAADFVLLAIWSVYFVFLVIHNNRLYQPVLMKFLLLLSSFITILFVFSLLAMVVIEQQNFYQFFSKLGLYGYGATYVRLMLGLFVYSICASLLCVLAVGWFESFVVVCRCIGHYALFFHFFVGFASNYALVRFWDVPALQNDAQKDQTGSNATVRRRYKIYSKIILTSLICGNVVVFCFVDLKILILSLLMILLALFVSAALFMCLIKIFCATGMKSCWTDSVTKDVNGIAVANHCVEMKHADDVMCFVDEKGFVLQPEVYFSEMLK